MTPLARVATFVFVAGTGGACAWFALRSPEDVPAAKATTLTAPSAETAASWARNNAPERLPSIDISGTERPTAPVDAAALERRIREMESQIGRMQQAAADIASKGASAGLPAAAVSAPRAQPYIIPGTENSPGGPIMADFGPPWPYNHGARGQDPPAVPGAGCLTCDSVPESEKAGPLPGTGSH